MQSKTYNALLSSLRQIEIPVSNQDYNSKNLDQFSLKSNNMTGSRCECIKKPCSSTPEKGSARAGLQDE
jgi:hypothetical protein